MSSSSAQLLVVLSVIVITISNKTCKASDGHQCHSLCGNHNVSHPFRLQQFPEDCGDQRYNLSCEHNQLVLYWQSGRYNVLSINYDNYTIRLRDSNIVEFKYSSLPHFSLAEYNFTEGDPYATNQRRSRSIFEWKRKQIRLTKMMTYVRYKGAVNSSRLVDNAPCIKASNISAASSSSYLYANAGGETLSDLGLGDGGRIELVYMTSWPALTKSSVSDRHSCTDIHNMLLYGFELSWLNSFCLKPYLAYFDNKNKPRCESYTVGELMLWDKIVPRFYRWILWYTKAPLFSGWILWDNEEVVHKVGVILAYFLGGRFVLGALLVIALLIYKWRQRHLSIFDNIEDFLQSDNNIMPIRYSYREIKKMTKGFKVKLGKGGYGSVFKGQLRSGRLVAIKMLDNAKADGQEFINEVATLGRIHHVNVVQLIGFCAEGSKRALIYEFMENGSLDKYIHSQKDNASLSIDKLYEISLSVACGIGYLHNGCNMQILHFDIKPHNILLDEHFNPKVSDFGLAKLCPTNNSIVSLTAARGTIGYMAPELFYKNVGGVSYKADVYSFGMLLMEMASRRKNLNVLTEHSSQHYFPFWVYGRLNEGKEINIENVTEEEMKMAKNMMIVALWCIQTRPSDRPSMNKVVEMLEVKEEDLQLPNEPYLYSEYQPETEVKNDTSSTTLSYSYDSYSIVGHEESIRGSSISIA